MNRRISQLVNLQSNSKLKLLKNIRYEIFPMKNMISLYDKIKLENNVHVSVSCSPVGGIETTKMVCNDLIQYGNINVVPHISSSLIKDRNHMIEISNWLDEKEIKNVMIIGGDSKTSYYYSDASVFMYDLLEYNKNLNHISFAGYPVDLPSRVLNRKEMDKIILNKQDIILKNNKSGEIINQMCFDIKALINWMKYLRNIGFILPFRIGIPGVIKYHDLLKISNKLNIQTTTKFLFTNTSIMSTLLFGYYQPNQMIEQLEPYIEELNIIGIHCFTFNCLDNTISYFKTN